MGEPGGNRSEQLKDLVPQILWYAELLFNIHQLTVYARLPSIWNNTTKACIDNDVKVLRLQHEGASCSIALPCSIVNLQPLLLPEAPSQDLSFRFVVAETTELSARYKDGTSSSTPFSATQLISQSRMSCQSCRATVVENVPVWKDLPSGGWADMMDLWHCHKPTTEDGHGPTESATKGYAASNAIGPTSGTGLVDVDSFWLATEQCRGLQVCDQSLIIFP